MKLTFLGTASGLPVLNRSHSALLVQQNDESILLDAGEGVSHALLRTDVNLDSITRVYISHTHADHVIGIPMLLQMLYLKERKEPLTIYCPSDRCDWLIRLLEGLFIVSDKWTFPFDVLPLPLSGETLQKNVELRFYETNHLTKVRLLASSRGYGASAYGFILREGEVSVVISSDVESINDVSDVCSDAHLLIIECTHVPVDAIFNFVQKKENLRVIITHIPPEIETRITFWEEKSKHEIHSRMIFAHDGLVVDTNTLSYGN